MLEGLVANLLNRFLGMYVQNFDPKQLNVGIWSGDVKLRNLELRREALDQLKLPLNVVHGHLGSLTMSIPWSNLRGKPVRVNIEDVFLLAAPKEDAEYNAEEEEKRAHNLKMEKLDSAELLKERNTEGMSMEEQKKNQSFVASLTAAIVDNVQVSVKNIHIRYEDSISDPGHPFSLGFTLEEFSAVSTDENWKPTFIQGGAQSSHKLATLGSLAVYWNTDTKLLGTGKGTQSRDHQGVDRSEFIDKLKSMIARGDSSEEAAKHQFVLKPVSGRAGLEMDKTGKADRPKVKARLLFDELGFIIDEDQYRDALMLIDLFHYFIRHQEYKKFQPKSRPTEDPRAWLQFAGTAVLERIHDRNKIWSWAYFKERRDDRIAYISLFKKKKKDEKLTPEELEQLDKLERKLTYEDLRFWRSLARNQLRKENVGVIKKQEPQKQTWSQWVWGGGKKQEQQHTEDDSQMSEQQRKELYNAIDWDEKKTLAEAIDMPKEYVKMQVEMSLRTGGFTLKRDPHGKGTEILRLLFDSFSTKVFQRTDSMLAEVSLDGMRLYDGTTEGNLFPQIITIKDARPVSDENRIEELNDDETPKQLDGATNDENEEPFFQLSFENNPLDGSADTALTMKLKAMEIVYNPKFLVEVAKFFKPPERHMESIAALMETAGETVEDIRKQTRAGLEFALEEHKTINAQLDLQAPLIIVPDSVTEKSSICLIVDAGHISVSSELVDKDTMKNIQSKQKQQYTEQDFKRLESLMYDKFLLKLDSTQVLIGNSIEETRAQLEDKSSKQNLHLIDRINMDFTVEICIVPKGTDLTKFKVVGNLPVLHASVSDSKYKKLMKLIDVAIPKFDKDEKETKEIAYGASGPSNFKPTKSQDDPIGRQRGKSFQFSAQDHELVMEEDSDDTKSDDYKKASQPKQKPDVNLRQRNFEFKFTADKLLGSLYKSDPEGKKEDELLVELVAERFGLDFYQEPFNMVAEVRLSSLAVEDHVDEDPLPEFKNLISSEDTDGTSQKDLFSLEFVKVNKDSPEFMTKYEGIGTNLDVSVSTINVIVTRKTLLTLLDFVLLTFTNSETQQQQKQIESKSKDENDTTEVAPPPTQDPDKIRIKTNLKRIAIILNNDGIRLATLSLNTADVAVFVMGPTLRVGARLGNLSLIDDVNQGVSEESSLRQLLAIEGDELGDFKYETYDPQSDVYPGYDTSIYLRAASIKVNFITEPFRKIMEFGVKFGKMQAIFNAARQAAANQANQIQQRANKMHFDILVNTPIVVFPRMVISDKPGRDLLTAYLGEIYAKNEFVALDDSEQSDIANKIIAGIRNVRMTSNLHYEDDKSEVLELIDKVDIDFKITMVDHKVEYKRPDLEIEGSMSDIHLRITQEQMQFGLELARSIPAAFAIQADEDVQEDVEQELPESVVEPAKEVSDEESIAEAEVTTTSQNPELGVGEEKWTKLDLVFKVGSIGLELIKAKEDQPVGDLEAASLSKFALNQTSVKLRMISDGALESEVLIQSFTIKDSRTHETNKFRKIMSLINNDVKQQFMASVSISGSKERNLVAILTIDSPRIILALDYLFAIQQFVTSGLAVEEPLVIEDETEDDALTDPDTASTHSNTVAKVTEDTDEKPVENSGMSISFRVNVVDAQIILIANPAITNSEAIVLGTKQVLVTKQQAMTLQVDKVGMFLCRMDHFETNRLRILDDFSIQTSLDIRNQGKDSSLTSINVNIEPLVLRLSLRDILLAMQIFNRASAMNSDDNKQLKDQEPEKLKQIKGTSKVPTKQRGTSTARKSAKSIRTKNTSTRNQSTAVDHPGSTTLKREEMKIQLEGIRVVLIGDLHELPILDWSVKEFDIDVRDWSGAMTADTNIDTFFNVYNFSKSAWEPLVEPWQLGFHLSKEQHPERMSVDLYSRKALELTLTSATIALASKSAQFLSTDEDILSKPRGTDAPYRVRNYTGFDIDIWAAETRNDDDGAAAKLTDGEEAPWRFEDPSTTRETLSPEGASGIVGIRLQGSGFDSVERIPVTREGEVLYDLRPRQDKVLHRLLVEVTLGGDNVKYITFRSPLLVENKTQIPVEIGVFSPEEGHLLKIEKIAPGDARPAPVGAAFMHSLIVRPDQGFGYTWSDQRLFWKDLLKKPTRTIMCRGEQDQQAPPFYFQMHAAFDKKNSLTGVYPYMRIRLHAPIEVQNLLPFDFKYRIYDEDTKKDWTNFLRKGGVSPVHVVELSHLLLLSVDLQDTPFKPSKFAVVNSNDRDNFKRERTLEIKDDQDLALRLKLHFLNIPDSGGAFKVTVYSPYVVLNRTGIELDVRSKQFLGSTKAAAGQSVFGGHGDTRKPLPFMFNFPTDDRKNRALIKVGDSGWSKPQSLDALGSNYDVTLPSSSGRSEMHIGVTVDEGEGKYKLTKVVTIAPRFVVKNKLGEEINIREPGSSEVMSLKNGDLLPLRFLKQSSGHQQICLCFPGMNNQWSSPFNISNVGPLHVKLSKAGQRQKLVRVDILMEDATLFIHCSIETKHWPFSMRNESDTEFVFFQTNPNLDEDEEDRTSGWRPIRYRLPPRSIMPYAWDYPAAKSKEVVLVANNKERHVKLAEIGNLIPMKLPPVQGGSRQKIIDLNVVADGPTQTLVLSNYKPSKSIYKQKSPSRASASSSTVFEVKEQDMDTTFQAQIRFAGIGLSLINRQLKELIYLTLRDIEFKYSDSPLYQTVNASIKWIQIDNQLYGGIFPIIFYPSVVPKTGKQLEAHPIFKAMVTRVKDDSYGVLYIKYFTFLMQQMTIEIDEDFIFALLDFTKVPGASWSEEVEGKLWDEELDIPEPKQEQSSQDIYFETLHLQPMQFDLSFVRTERINAEDTMTIHNPFMFAVNVLTMSIGNVNDAPIKYNALVLENARVSMNALLASIKSHYVQESVNQIHVIIGSADFLGNPVGLFNNISSGVADIFYEPYQGLVTERPQDLGLGIAKGASSFVKKSVFGFSDSMAKFTGSMSKGLAAATMDKEFQNKRRMNRARNRPKHALYGITSGGNAFAESLASGIGGLARHPLQGAEKEGAAGFVKGVGKGLLGIPTKAAIGAFDLASNMAEGVRNTTTVFDQEGLDRVRLTRFIGQDGVVRPYSQREALGQFWLKTLDSGKHFDEEYIAHLELQGKDMLILLTYNSILLVKTKRLQTEWEVKLKDIQTISKERTGLSVVLKGGVNGPFVPVADEQSRNWFYRQVAVAVNAFNERWSAKG